MQFGNRIMITHIMYSYEYILCLVTKIELMLGVMMVKARQTLQAMKCFLLSFFVLIFHSVVSSLLRHSLSSISIKNRIFK